MDIYNNIGGLSLYKTSQNTFNLDNIPNIRDLYGGDELSNNLDSWDLYKQNNMFKWAFSKDKTTSQFGKSLIDESIETPASITSLIQESSTNIKNPYLKKSKMGKAGDYLGMASDIIGSFLPEKAEYSGDKGKITQTMDSVYDGISNGLITAGGPLALVGGIMKGAQLVGKGLNAIGLNTDGMTGIDAALGSSFLNLTPIGLINAAGAKKTDEFSRNQEAYENLGSSYLGSYTAMDDSEHKSGKKYGLFSRKQYKETQANISENRRQDNLLQDISNTAKDIFSISQSTAAINENRRQYNMQGGYKQKATKIGKQGMKLEDLYRAKRIVSTIKYLNGGKTIDPFQYYLSTLPKNQQDSTNYRVRDYWEFNGKPKDFNEAVERGMFVKEQDSWHASSVAENPNTGEIEFMKHSNHPTHYMEIDWYNSNNPEAIQFRNEWELVKSNPYWKYVKRKSISKHRDGGTIQSLLKEVSIDNLPKEFFEDDIQEFEKGGRFNLIPEGALHARKHNIDIEGITKKGIPVVSESEDGEIEQHAEIECSEIIFRLEVTQKLEELKKNFENDDYTQSEKDNFAIEAGKLLVQEILYNTQDNTELINTIC